MRGARIAPTVAADLNFNANCSLRDLILSYLLMSRRHDDLLYCRQVSLCRKGSQHQTEFVTSNLAV